METALFYVFAAIAVVPGIFILVSNEIVRMALWLLASLSGFAGLYFVLRADLLAFLQIIVYVGGILVLFLFGVMLTRRDPLMLKKIPQRRLVMPGVAVGMVCAGALLHVVFNTNWKEPANPSEAEAFRNIIGKINAQGTTETIGELIMSDFLLPFEVVSILLLVALVGSTYLARRRGEAS